MVQSEGIILSISLWEKAYNLFEVLTGNFCSVINSKKGETASEITKKERLVYQYPQALSQI